MAPKSTDDSSVASGTLKAWSLSRTAGAAADGKAERVMAEQQLPLPRQFELLGSATV